MIKSWKLTIYAGILLLLTLSAHAQTSTGSQHSSESPGYWSISNSFQLSFADVHYDGSTTSKFSIPRITWILNAGAHYHYDFNENAAVYTGVEVTNLGVIIKTNGVKHKRRVYTLGVPLAFELGSLKWANFFAGIQIDRAFQYQEKLKVGDSVQSKFGEWWSDRTPHVMGSWFIGARFFHAVFFKIQPYFTNFFNENYVDGTGARPYAGTTAKPILFCAGIDIPLGRNYIFMSQSPGKSKK